MLVVDDCMEGNNVRITFDDDSSVVVNEVCDARPPHFVQVSGDFTQPQVDAIVTWSRLSVRPQ